MESVDRTEPSLALDQLELALDGVSPLSPEERVQRWLAEQAEESVGAYSGLLFLQDGRTRAARARRWFELRTMQAPYDRDFWMVPGGEEVSWLYYESDRAFVDGLFLASLLCAHAACERVLAGCLEPHREQLDKRWLRWGLGQLVQETFRRDFIDAKLRDDLLKLAELRKTSAHYKPPSTPNTILLRAYNSAPTFQAESVEELLDETLHSDALFALRVATELIRGEEVGDRAFRLS